MQKRQEPRRRTTWLTSLVFLALIFVSAVCGTYVALRLFGDDPADTPVPEIITVEIIITATPAPTSFARTVDDSAQSGAVELPANVAGEASAIATLDAREIGAVDAVISAPTVAAEGESLSDKCVFHTVVAGDTPYAIAQRYGADRNLLLEVNGLTVETAVGLQIGKVLTVPLEGCDIGGSSSAAGGVASPTPLPTEVEITLASVEGIGDITAEGIALRNDGGQLNISGWSIGDEDGNRYTLPDMLLYTELVLYTRTGASTASALFWNKDESVWSAGETVTIADAAGNVRKTLTIPAADE